MVVMSEVVGKAPSDGKLDKTTFDQLSAAVTLLHGANLVHGDLRPNNVIVSDEGVFVVDFDWSGENEIHRYPYFMNDEISWPGGVGENATMKFDHDTQMLKRMEPVLRAALP
jgi:RIO-like serine/threonine protein kinase